MDGVIRTINLMLEPLRHRIRMMAARIVIQAVNDAKKMQLVQVTGLAGEVLDGLEHFQTYGLTSNPFPGAEGLGIFLGGNRETGIVICVDDRRYRLTGLAQGEVALYDDQGSYIKLARGNKIIVNSTGEVDVTAITKVVVSAPEIDLTATIKIVASAPEIDLTATTKVVVTAPEIDLAAATVLQITGADVTIAGTLEVGGTLTANGALVASGALTAATATIGGKAFATHKHSGVTTGANNTGNPI